jgi:rubrerythrin
MTSGAFAAALPAGCASSSVAATSGVEVDALHLALDDEYRAEATYAAVIDAFGPVRPFVNIIEAERRHADRVKAEMDRLGITYIRDNPYLGKIAAPASLLAACEQGVDAEIENIALYDRLLPTLEDASILATLTALQRASRENHLPAFERCVARGGEMGSGQGCGQGRRRGRSQ